MDCPDKLGKINFVITYIRNYAITQPFLELQTPDFAWKFVWIVPTNYAK